MYNEKKTEFKDVLEKNIKFKQLISSGNYSCVGIPYEDALNAIKEYADHIRQEKDKEISEFTQAYQSRQSEVVANLYKEIALLKKELDLS